MLNIERERALTEIVSEIEKAISQNQINLIPLLVGLVNEKTKLIVDEVYLEFKYQYARYLRRISKLDEAETVLTKLIEKENKKSNIIEYLQTLAFVKLDKNELDLALKSIEKSKQLSEEINDTVNIVQNMKNLGDIFYSKGLFKKSIENYQNCVNEIKKSLKEKDLEKDDIGFLNLSAYLV